jgi:hypothetical protein
VSPEHHRKCSISDLFQHCVRKGHQQTGQSVLGRISGLTHIMRLV